MADDDDKEEEELSDLFVDPITGAQQEPLDSIPDEEEEARGPTSVEIGAGEEGSEIVLGGNDGGLDLGIGGEEIEFDAATNESDPDIDSDAGNIDFSADGPESPPGDSQVAIVEMPTLPSGGEAAVDEIFVGATRATSEVPEPGLPDTGLMEAVDDAAIDENVSTQMLDSDPPLDPGLVPGAADADSGLGQPIMDEPEEPAEPPQSIEETESDVNQMLETAVLGSSPDSDSPEATPTSERTDEMARFFEIRLRNVTSELQRKQALAVLEHFPVGTDLAVIGTKLEQNGGYRFSHLGEFHANGIMQGFCKADLHATLSIPIFDQGIVPEDTDAAGILAADPIESTGAIAVAIPESPKEVLLSTGDRVVAYIALKNMGVISTHGSVSRKFFREHEQEERLVSKINELRPPEESEDHSKHPKPISLPKAEIDKVFQSLLKKLQREAFRRGANGVIGIHVSGFPEQTAFDDEFDQIRLIASGTAVSLEPEKPAEPAKETLKDSEEMPASEPIDFLPEGD